MPNASDIRWFKEQFHEEIEPALEKSPFDLDMLVSIACQETGEIWPILRKTSLSKQQILALCVGDTIDYRGPNKGRQAFPRTKAALLAKPNGDKMFDIAREALVKMADYIPSYRAAAENPDKFCHGYGLFQRDIQFFQSDPAYFLNKKYENLQSTLEQCLSELTKSVNKLNFEDKRSLSDYDFACIAIAYNTGVFHHDKKLKQGYYDGEKYYGERIFDFLTLSRTIGLTGGPQALGQYDVVARRGLLLRNGPGLGYEDTKSLDAGTKLTVLGFDGPGREWAKVGLQDDGLADGHVLAAFLAPSGSSPDAEDLDIL